MWQPNSRATSDSVTKSPRAIAKRSLIQIQGFWDTGFELLIEGTCWSARATRAVGLKRLEVLMTLTRGKGRHLKVRLEDQLAQDIETFARSRNLSVSDAVRLLAREQLTAVANGAGNAVALAATSLATLIATEQVLKLLQVIVPQGANRSLDLEDDAADAARDRLERVERLIVDDEEA